MERLNDTDASDALKQPEQQPKNNFESFWDKLGENTEKPIPDIIKQENETKEWWDNIGKNVPVQVESENAVPDIVKYEKTTEPPKGYEISLDEMPDQSKDIEKPLVGEGEQYGEDRNLKTNIRYRTDDGEGRPYYYETDEHGRIKHCETDSLQYKNREGRLGNNPNTPEKKDTDDAGHLIADRFGGSPELDNLVSQESELNRRGGDWYNMEEEWAEALKEGKKVGINIELIYEGDSERPSSFDVYYTIDGEVHVKSFDNNSKGAD